MKPLRSLKKTWEQQAAAADNDDRLQMLDLRGRGTDLKNSFGLCAYERERNMDTVSMAAT